MAENSLAAALREQERFEEAIAALDKAVELASELTSKRMKDSRDAWSLHHRVRSERAWTATLGPLSQADRKERCAAAIAELDQAILGWNKLLDQLGESPTDRFRLSVASFQCGRLKADLGQRDGAAKDLNIAEVNLKRLLADSKERPMYLYELARVYTALGQNAEWAGAADWYRKAREILDALTQRFPGNVAYRKALEDLDAVSKGMR